jgi:hypothetical protein
MEDMDLGSQLTGQELLQLMHPEAKHPGSGAAAYDLAQLTPAAEQIDDLEGLAAFLQAAAHSDMGCNVIELLAADLPAVSKLAPESVAGFIRQCISGKIDYYKFLVEHPAVNSFSTATLQQMLLEIVQQPKKHDPNDQLLAHCVTLLKAPAATQLSVETVTTLLQHAVQELQRDWYWDPCLTFGEVQDDLLAPPAVQQLSADAMASILAAAITAANLPAVGSLCMLPAVQQLSVEAAAELHLLAVQKGYFRIAQRMQELPLLQGGKHQQAQLTSEQLQLLLRVAIGTGDREAIVALCQQAASPAAPHMSPESTQQLLSAAIQSLDSGRFTDITPAAAQQLFQLADAQTLGAAAVAELMKVCVCRGSAEGLQLVTLLPGSKLR